MFVYGNEFSLLSSVPLFNSTSERILRVVFASNRYKYIYYLTQKLYVYRQKNITVPVMQFIYLIGITLSSEKTSIINIFISMNL